jgi:hypothetical protein
MQQQMPMQQMPMQQDHQLQKAPASYASAELQKQ